MTDPLAPLLSLPGVADAANAAKDAVFQVHRHRVNLRGWATTAAEASVRAARASAALEGLTQWILFVCSSLEAGAREAKSIADAALTG